MSDGFEVVSADLRTAASGLGDQLTVAATMSQTAQAAQLPSDAWGLLGNSLGMYDDYSTLVTAANDHVSKVQDYLRWAQQNLAGTAGAYEQADNAVAASLPKS